jgi:hypothetical protein
MSDEVLIEELRTAMRAEVDDIEVAPAIVARVLESPPGLRLGLGWLMPALAVGVAVIVAVVAVTSLTHRSAAPQGATSRVPLAARGLAARLAVLRRPQRPADVLPHWAVRETKSLTYSPRIVEGLSRLVGAVNLGPDGRARVYVVVQRPPHSPPHPNHPEPPFLNPRLGDQATIAFVGRFRDEAAINGPAVAAGGETVAATGHGLTADPSQFSELWGAVASIVPDGVARVKWVFGGAGTRTPRLVVRPRVRDNVAIGRVPVLGRTLTAASWYGSDGQLIASFGRSTGSNQTALKFKRALERSLHQRIAPALLRHFALLTSSRVSGYPGLDGTEATALIEPNPLGLNTRRERFVVDPSGAAKVFVVPGSQGIALRYVSPGVGQVEGGTEDALSGSLFVESPTASGQRMMTGLAPDGNRTVTVLLRGGRTRVAPVVNNVYAIVVPASARTVILKNASGRTVHLHLA